MKSIKAIVSGKVQGVGFRMYTQQKSRQLGVKGYVKNLNNGNVEIVATGEVKAVDALIKWAESGSPSAVVDNVEIEEISKREFEGFDISR